jgi:tetratricopeptide (TPR) repeat protein
MAPMQMNRLVSVSNLIETGKYNEAKGIIEEMVEDEQAAQWARTWYTRGLLAQTAYRDGIRGNDKRKYELYPDQLYVAFESYEKAMELEPGRRLTRLLVPRYVLLANDFQMLGERSYNSRKYEESLRAFEHVMEISSKPFIEEKKDTNLLYNAGLAAFEARNFDKAVEYLGRLHQHKHSPNVTHLLHQSYLAQGDSASARETLREGIGFFDKNEDLVLLLVDLMVKQNDHQAAIDVLEEAIAEEPDNYQYYNTKGLVLQKSGEYRQAITAFEQALENNPEAHATYLNIATSYYNIGVEYDMISRTLTINRLVQEQRAKAQEAFDTAASWLNKAEGVEKKSPSVESEIQQLLRMLRVGVNHSSVEEPEE